jgi:hypothetical protein
MTASGQPRRLSFGEPFRTAVGSGLGGDERSRYATFASVIPGPIGFDPANP